MFEHCIIIVFTRNRPSTLEVTLNALQAVPYPKYVIDDSTLQESMDRVEKLCVEMQNCHYFGTPELDLLLNDYHEWVREFVVGLGQAEWNLGNARNIGLLLARSQNADKVLFMDDDIVVEDLDLINSLFDKLDEYRFTGALVSGLPDDSILGHIASAIGIPGEKMLSGGFLAFKPSDVVYPFLNIYNEDWIWLYFHLEKGGEPLQDGQVLQLPSNPFDNALDKIQFQEFGETIIEGILFCNGRGFDQFSDPTFWQKTLVARKEYLGMLRKRTIETNGVEFLELLDEALRITKSQDASKLSSFFTAYFHQLERFRQHFLKN